MCKCLLCNLILLCVYVQYVCIYVCMHVCMYFYLFSPSANRKTTEKKSYILTMRMNECFYYSILFYCSIQYAVNVIYQS